MGEIEGIAMVSMLGQTCSGHAPACCSAVCMSDVLPSSASVASGRRARARGRIPADAADYVYDTVQVQRRVYRRAAVADAVADGATVPQ